MSMKTFLQTLLLIIFFQNPCIADDINLAVLDLDPIGVSATDAKALSEKLRSSIVQISLSQHDVNDTFRIMERSQMDKIFSQFEIQNTGCTDVSCAVEFGKMLDARRIIIGSISLVGETYMIICRIVDIESSQILLSVDRDYQGQIDGVIKILPEIGAALLQMSIPLKSQPNPPIKDNPSSTSIHVKPQALVYSDSLVLLENLNFPLTLILIPGGEFTMGSFDGDGDERPMKKIAFDAFYMSAYEITQEQYLAVMHVNPSYYQDNNLLPVEKVSWIDAAEFCNSLSKLCGLRPCYNERTWICDFSADGFRLPTEAEWEYACRAGTDTDYYSGSSEEGLRLVGWYSGNSNQKTHLVGQKTPNSFGLFDMHGNVFEWCNDFYTSYQSYASDLNLTLDSGRRKVARGGSWYVGPRECKSSKRSVSDENLRHPTVGIRVVKKTQ